MRFAHIADIHIGSWRDPKMKELSSHAFIETINSALSEKADFILIAGDLFNTALPSIDHAKLVVRKLREVKEKGIPVYYIAGSHDYSPSGKTMLDVLEEADLGVNVTRGEVTSKGSLKLEFTVDKKTGAKITGIIGRRGMLEREYYEVLDRGSLEAEKGFKIFMFHTALDELKPEELKNMDSSPASFLPKGFDYYAGGHVHIVKAKDLPGEGYKNIVYPGPTFPANFSEMEKLGCGGYYLYDNGELKRKDVKVKDVVRKTINVNGLTAEQSNVKIKKETESINAKGNIVLLRIEGTLTSGKIKDLEIQGAMKELLERGAYHVLKNTTGITTKEFEEIKTAHSSTEEIESKIIEEHIGKTKHNFKNEKDATHLLIETLSSEKHEGEKQTDYEERILSEASTVLEKQSKKN